MSDMLRTEHEQRSSSGAEVFGAAMLRPVPLRPDLRRTVERLVIPRVRQALADVLHTPVHPLVCVASGSGPTLGEAEVGCLAERLAAGDRNGCLDLVDSLVRTGVSLERIFLELLAAAASRLHDLQADDVLGLAEASLAFCNLQAVLRHYAQGFRGETGNLETGRRALLVAPSPKAESLPMFGLLLLSEFFRRDGWDAWIERDLSSGPCRDTVLTEWFDLVEVMASSDRELDAITSGIKAIRRRSPNRAIGVIVCGAVFREHPEFVRLVGADFMASDPLTSLTQARKIIARSTSRRRLA